MNPSSQVDPPDEPPAAWRLRDLERRMEATEQRVGAEMLVNARNDELLNGEFGLIAAVKANTLATKANTDALAAVRDVAAKEREEVAVAEKKKRQERTQWLWRTAIGLAISVFLIYATVVISGALAP
jgi:hypothetical protein